MAKIEQRPVDSGVAAAKGQDDAALVKWWKQRFALIAGIPTEVARAGALIPQMRELAALPEVERRRLTKARMLAFVALPADQRQQVIAGRKLVNAIDPELARSDDAVATALAPEVPASDEIRRQMEA